MSNTGSFFLGLMMILLCPLAMAVVTEPELERILGHEFYLLDYWIVLAWFFFFSAILRPTPRN